MRKQSSKESDWIELWKTCTEIVPESRLNSLEHQAISKIRFVASKGKFAYGYSGGKDSVVLKHLIEKAFCSNMPCFSGEYINEYPAMRKFIRATAPKNTTYIPATDHDFDFLNKNPDYLFPEKSSKTIIQKYTRAWRDNLPAYCKKLGIKSIVTGRRIEDGNHCGAVIDFIHTSKNKDVTSYNVIADWTQAELLAYIKSRQLLLAPIYSYPNGFKYGTHAWIERERVNHSIFETFDEVWEIDKNIVIDAAKNGLEKAKEYLEFRKDFRHE